MATYDENAIVEWRGVEHLVYAEVTMDSNPDTGEGYTVGTIKTLAGVGELEKSVESKSETHYYNNVPAIVIESVGPDTVKMKVSAVPESILADITGQYYNSELGMMVEGERDSKYYALGYVTEKTDGTQMLVWRHKGTFSIPSTKHSTKTDSATAEGMEITYTGINTTHIFEKTKRTAKATVVNRKLNPYTIENWFSTMKTPDNVTKQTGA